VMPRKHLLQTKLNDEELKRVEIAVQAQGITIAALMRSAILAYIGAPGTAPSVHERLRILEARAQWLFDRERIHKDRISSLEEQVRELRSRR
jgi:hypothetical protein